MKCVVCSCIVHTLGLSRSSYTCTANSQRPLCGAVYLQKFLPEAVVTCAPHTHHVGRNRGSPSESLPHTTFRHFCSTVLYARSISGQPTYTLFPLGYRMSPHSQMSIIDGSSPAGCQLAPSSILRANERLMFWFLVYRSNRASSDSELCSSQIRQVWSLVVSILHPWLWETGLNGLIRRPVTKS
ncbi:hypothetical protein EDB92DRAFT_1857602 [Lactarius akahatsu]|uniref:Uncharacterized protein n=1 Tax=Lactarius akahatsu TaxID=416441 RepID=A0AAD4LKB2_9AGAM|nr:hypothetical protein EDB92DRAFT_1857602 [Lactarius akahatsu]